MAEWRKLRVADVAIPKGLVGGPFGSSLGSKDYVDSGIPVIRGTNLGSGGKFDDRDFVFVKRKKAEQELARNLAEPGDVVFTQRGTLGQVGIVPVSLYDRYVISQSQMRLRVNRAIAIPEFIYYQFRSPEMVASIHSHAITTGVPHINLGILGSLEIALPPLAEQRAIVAVLGALDDKIIVNEKIGRKVSDLAKAMMTSLWRRFCVSTLIGEAAAGNSMVERTTLGDLCAAGGGAIQTGPFGSQLHAADYVEDGIPSVMPQNIGDNIVIEEGVARISSADIRRLSKYILAEGDIVYSRRGDVKRRALVRKHEDGWLCGTGCLRVRVGRAADPLFMSHYLGEPEIQDWILQQAVGATMPNLNTSILERVPVNLPPFEARERISADLWAVDERAVHAYHENRILAGLRDVLLPKLMSGELHVNDAERVVGDAS